MSKLGTALSVVFVVSLVALVAELVYVLWRRHLFRQQTASGDGGDALEVSSSSASKELHYFLCWKHQSRIEPHGGANQTRGVDGLSPHDPTEVIDVLKLQGMYGPSRVLFTIKEEEKEGAESDQSLPLSVFSSQKLPQKTSSEECSGVAEESPNVIVIVIGDRETTPFSTACDSPPYYTPTASPTRKSDSGFAEGGVIRC